MDLPKLYSSQPTLPKVEAKSNQSSSQITFHNILMQIKLKFGIGYRGRCLLGVTSLTVSHGLTRVTGSSLLYQCMERILFPVCHITKTTRENEDDIWNT